MLVIIYNYLNYNIYFLKIHIFKRFKDNFIIFRYYIIHIDFVIFSQRFYLYIYMCVIYILHIYRGRERNNCLVFLIIYILKIISTYKYYIRYFYGICKKFLYLLYFCTRLYFCINTIFILFFIIGISLNIINIYTYI